MNLTHAVEPDAVGAEPYDPERNRTVLQHRQLTHTIPNSTFDETEMVYRVNKSAVPAGAIDEVTSDGTPTGTGTPTRPRSVEKLRRTKFTESRRLASHGSSSRAPTVDQPTENVSEDAGNVSGGTGSEGNQQDSADSDSGDASNGSDAGDMADSGIEEDSSGSGQADSTAIGTADGDDGGGNERYDPCRRLRWQWLSLGEARQASTCHGPARLGGWSSISTTGQSEPPERLEQSYRVPYPHYNRDVRSPLESVSELRNIY